MEQLERIKRMERNLDQAISAVTSLQNALEHYVAVQPQIRELMAYYDSGDWLKDYDDDCAGKLPRDLKRGVLSEDAVYDLSTELTSLRSLLNVLAR